MTAWLKLSWVDLKLFFRSPIVVFFTFAFPVLNVFLFGSMYGNEPSPMFGGFGAIDVMIPGYIAALVIGATAFMNLPLEITGRRQMGVLRRLRTSPLHPLAVIGSQVVIGLFTAALSAVLLVVTGKLVFDAVVPQFSLALVVAFMLGCLSMFSFAIMLSNFIRNMAAARAVFMALFFPMMFLSGGTLPLQFLPKIIQDFSKFLPLTYVVNLVNEAYLNQNLLINPLLILSIILVISVGLGVVFFRWE